MASKFFASLKFKLQIRSLSGKIKDKKKKVRAAPSAPDLQNNSGRGEDAGIAG